VHSITEKARFDILAGTKQHFIPQFLLREFAHERKRGAFQIRVHRADRTYLSAVEDVAAQKHFYSDSAIDSRLDDQITSAETHFAQMHRQLKASADINAADAAVLVSHLSMRGSHLRKFVEHAGSNAMTLLGSAFSDVDFARRSLGIDKPELEGALREEFDRKYNELRGEGGLRNVSRHQFRTLLHGEIRKRFGKFYVESIDERNHVFQAMREVANAEFIADAHNRALSKDIAPVPLTETYRALTWSRLVDESFAFIMPDCVSVALQANGEFVPTVLAGADDFNQIYFPISSGVVLVGSKGRSPNVSVEELNYSFASSSWEFFVSNPELEPQEELQEAIRSSALRQLQSLLSEAFEDIATGG
jgi:Protein of unknown function (DUF4238)